MHDPKEILHGLKCILGAPFCACIQNLHNCKLLSSFSGFRSKNTTYGTLASGLHMQ